MSEWEHRGQCEACEVDGHTRPIHSEYGLCEECISARGWSLSDKP